MLKQNIPAVVLVGGRSSRMGMEKHLLDYGRGPQWKYMYHTLKQVFSEVYISCREDQVRIFDFLPCVLDQWKNIGPMGAIASSFLRIPEAHSIFIVSCDLPFFSVELVEKLTYTNDQTKAACCTRLVGKDYPDPLVAIWNRNSLPLLQQAILKKEYSLQKLLKTTPFAEYVTDRKEWLYNANTPEEFAKAKNAFNIP